MKLVQIPDISDISDTLIDLLEDASHKGTFRPAQSNTTASPSTEAATVTVSQIRGVRRMARNATGNYGVDVDAHWLCEGR
jgi:uncharacterized protein YdbL (DUF1318 family)